MNNDTMIADVQHLLGRVINSQGEPIDGRGAISGTVRLPLYDFTTAETKAAIAQISLFETGIKVVDLLAPIPRGSIFAMHSMPGLGKVVVQQEIIHNLTTHYDGYVVGIGMNESSYGASEVMAPLEALSDKQKMVLVFEQMSDSQQVLQHLIRVGLAVAIELRKQGHEVMFIVDKNVVTRADASMLGALKRAIQEHGLITLFLTPEERGNARSDEENDALIVPDANIFFSRELAKQDIWPAIDRTASTSPSRGDGLPRPGTLADDSPSPSRGGGLPRPEAMDASWSSIGQEHKAIARQVRELLQHYGSTQVTGPQDQQMTKRAQRLQQFLTQPFFVAEAFTDIPGEFVPLADTLQGCKELLDGRYDDVPVEAFHFIGTIEQALAKAKASGK